MTASVMDFPRPMSVLRADPRTDAERLTEALRVNDQLSRELEAMKGEQHVVVIRKYWIADEPNVTAGELTRTIEALIDAGICRPQYRPLLDDENRIAGLELIAVVSPRRSASAA